MQQTETNSSKNNIPRPPQMYRVEVPKMNSSQNTDSMSLQKSTRRVRLESPNFHPSRDKSPGERLNISIKSLQRANLQNNNDNSIQRRSVSPALNQNQGVSNIQRNLEEEYNKSFTQVDESNKILNTANTRRYLSANQSFNSTNRSMNIEESENRVLKLKNKGADELTNLLHRAHAPSQSKAKDQMFFKSSHHEDSSPSASINGITDREKKDGSGIVLQESFPRIKHSKGIENTIFKKPSAPRSDNMQHLPAKPSSSKSEGKFAFKRRNRLTEKTRENSENHDKAMDQYLTEARAARPKSNNDVFERLSVSQNQTTDSGSPRKSTRQSLSTKIKIPLRNDLFDSKSEMLTFQPGNSMSRNVVEELRVMFNAVDLERKAKEEAMQSMKIATSSPEGAADDTLSKTRKVRIRTTFALPPSKPSNSVTRNRGSTTGCKRSSNNSVLKLEDKTFSSEVKHIMKQLDDKALENLDFRTPTFLFEEPSHPKSFCSNKPALLSNIVPGLHADDDKLRIISIQSILKKPKP